MKLAITHVICRLLVTATALLPFAGAQAGMIATENAVAGAVQERALVSEAVARSEVARALTALGVDPQSATRRVAVMTDAEVHALAGNLEALPAGGTGIGIPLVIAAIIAAAILYKYK